MTNEEAIKILKSKMDGSVDTSYEWAETVRMAINALEQWTSEDCIRREDALLALCKAVHKNDDNIPCSNQRISCLWSDTKVSDYASEIKRLPSVYPKSKAGRWIITIDEDGTSYWLCSKCRCGSDKATNFCPECGSDNSEG